MIISTVLHYHGTKETKAFLSSFGKQNRCKDVSALAAFMRAFSPSIGQWRETTFEDSKGVSAILPLISVVCVQALIGSNSCEASGADNKVREVGMPLQSSCIISNPPSSFDQDKHHS